MILKLVTPPAGEPVSLDEAKRHLRIDIDDDDLLIGGLITAAREVCELQSRRALLTQAYDLVLEAWPGDDRLYQRTQMHPYQLRTSLQLWPRPVLPIKLPRPPLQTVSSVTYTDYAGITNSLATTDYIVDADSEPGRVLPAYNKMWPSAVLQPGPAIRVRFTCGYGAASAVPQIYKQALLLLVGHFYENREEVVVSGNVNMVQLPMAVESLLALDRGWW
ncbi:MAG: head-tail connector protein [Caldilineaceae bacterium]